VSAFSKDRDAIQPDIELCLLLDDSCR